jgi:hemerythrin-like metal-binding protein
MTHPTSLTEKLEQRWLLGIPEMDDTHREFAEMVDGFAELEPGDREAFADRYQQLVKHTADHFQNEEKLMCDSGFFATSMHKGEHERVLAEMMRMGGFLQRGQMKMVRDYVLEHLPGWFEQHAATMDSALAGHLKNRGVDVKEIGGS